MTPTRVELFATVMFAVAVVHTFAAGAFQRLARRYREGSVAENLLHLLGEVEIVFAFWAGVLLVWLAATAGPEAAAAYLEGRHEGYEVSFTEPLFVFVVMTMAATRPVRELAEEAVATLARRLPMPRSASIHAVALSLGPLLGSLITEPAAMTVTALLLRDAFFGPRASARLKHRTLAVLFVNVSIGGTLTHFAAPPVVMVAETWRWDLRFMLLHFGWKAALAVLINAAIATAMSYRELAALDAAPAPTDAAPPREKRERVPAWVTVLHLVFLGVVVMTAHHPAVFLGIFLFFLGVVRVTEEHQEPLALREGLLVAAFLGGLVVLGTFQKWWLSDVITRLGETPLFFGAAALTAVTDNAALTYLGSLVPGIPEGSKYALVAGAVAGGGLTVIANAPNPVGYGILKSAFGDGGLHPARLALAAALPTAIAAALLFGLRAL